MVGTIIPIVYGARSSRRLQVPIAHASGLVGFGQARRHFELVVPVPIAGGEDGEDRGRSVEGAEERAVARPLANVLKLMADDRVGQRTPGEHEPTEGLGRRPQRHVVKIAREPRILDDDRLAEEPPVRLLDPNAPGIAGRAAGQDDQPAEQVPREDTPRRNDPHAYEPHDDTPCSQEPP